MAWTTLTKTDAAHDAGKPVTKDLLIDPVIDDLNYLFDEVAISAPAVKNGSFENGTVGANQTPASWTWTAYTGGTRAISSTTGEQSHGQNGVKITHPSGGSNGGGYLTTDDFIPCTVQKLLFIAWEMKVSAANGAQNKVTIFWYKKDQTASAVTNSSVIYDDTAGTTSWTQCMSGAQPPSDATFFKIRVTGGDTATDPGSSTDIFFDNVRIVNGPADVYYEMTETTYADTTYWVSPPAVKCVWVECIGGGGKGQVVNNAPSGGGAEYAAGYFVTAASAKYTIVTGGSATSTTFNISTVVANGGTTPTSGDSGAGGAGGTGGNGLILIGGQAGGAGSGSNVTGGTAGRGGMGSVSAATSSAGHYPGGGSGGATSAVGEGGDGWCKIWF
tara:strand:+ start:2236 stop:3396 length:1161 start_codon:yes stop_codon:yes gene_type:complete